MRIRANCRQRLCFDFSGLFSAVGDRQVAKALNEA